MKLCLSVLSLFIVSGLFGQPGPVNSVLGDTSWIIKYGEKPPVSGDENDRIVTHLNFVLERLKSDTYPDEAPNRDVCIELLENYINQGVFPRVFESADHRRPCFIDNDGNLCAVGHLMAETGGRDLAEHINAKYQYDRIRNMEDERLLNWQQKSGLSLDELAMIQPQYGDPLPCETYYDEKKRKYGLRELEDGRILAPAIYDYIHFGRAGNLAIAQKDSLWGIMNCKGRLITKLNYRRLIDISGRNGLFMGQQNHGFFLIDETGKAITGKIPGEYVQYSGEYNGYFVVKRKGAYGVITIDGRRVKSVVDPAYDDIRWVFNIGDGAFEVLRGEKYGLLNQEGQELIPIVYTSLEYPSTQYRKRTVLAKTEDKSFLYSEDGILSPITGVSDLSVYGNAYYTNLILAKKDGKFGLLRLGGQEWFIPPEFDQITKELNFHEVRKGDLYGRYSEHEGELVIPVKFGYISGIHNKLIVREGNKMGLLTNDGKEVIPVNKSAVDFLVNDLSSNLGHCFAVLEKGKWSIALPDGQTVPNLTFDQLERVNEKGFIARNGLKYHIGTLVDGQVMLSPVGSFQNIYVLSHNLLACKKNGKYGFLEYSNSRDWTIVEATIKPLYDSIYSTNFRDYRNFLVKKNDRFGIVRSYGEEVTKMDYTDLLVYTHPSENSNEVYSAVYLKKEEEWFLYTEGKGVTPGSPENPEINRSRVIIETDEIR